MISKDLFQANSKNKSFFFLLTLLLSWQSLEGAEKFSNWAVVTTINYPTAALKKLAQLPGWRVVVVGDKKTPADWQCQGCDFLSIEKQSELNYSITKFLPYNHYCRKNIGYLYAIEHGAHIIYDTDDDNILIDDYVHVSPSKATLQAVGTDKKTINPYALFGQPSVWPRGYPIMEVQTQDLYSVSQETVHPYVQQGLVNQDPDVDAIYRLTRPLPIFFENNNAIALAPKVMAPFNSQNTTFHYQAFWGLVIPISVAFRVSDIWRGYWVQRMLWDIGGVLSFHSPSAIQERNVHNYLKDFIDEWDLYTKTDSFLSSLINWQSTAPVLEERILNLFASMIEGDFFKNNELEFMEAWLTDLTTIGYSMPIIIGKHNENLD